VGGVHAGVARGEVAGGERLLLLLGHRRLGRVLLWLEVGITSRCCGCGCCFSARLLHCVLGGLGLSGGAPPLQSTPRASGREAGEQLRSASRTADLGAGFLLHVFATGVSARYALCRRGEGRLICSRWGPATHEDKELRC